MVRAGYVFVASIHQSRTGMSESFESMRPNTCAQIRPWFILSSKSFREWSQNTCELQGQYPLYRRFRGGLNTRHCNKQNSKPGTQPNELFQPQQVTLYSRLQDSLSHTLICNNVQNFISTLLSHRACCV